MTKIRRHDTASTSQPPRKGPIAVETPASPDHAPIAAPRSSGTKTASRIARLPGVMSAAPTLDRARGDQGLDRGGDGAEQRRAEGTRRPPTRRPAAAEVVPQRPADQDEARQRQRVRVHRPLQLREARVEVLADAGQRDVDDRAVEERHPGPQHGGQRTSRPRAVEADRGPPDPVARAVSLLGRHRRGPSAIATAACTGRSAALSGLLAIHDPQRAARTGLP